MDRPRRRRGGLRVAAAAPPRSAAGTERLPIAAVGLHQQGVVLLFQAAAQGGIRALRREAPAQREDAGRAQGTGVGGRSISSAGLAMVLAEFSHRLPHPLCRHRQTIAVEDDLTDARIRV